MTQNKISRIISYSQGREIAVKIGRYIYDYNPSTGEIIRTPAKGGAGKMVARV